MDRSYNPSFANSLPMEIMAPLFTAGTPPPGCTDAPSVATTVITADELGETVYVILSGSAKVHVIRPDSTEVILALLGHGEVAGEMSNAISPK